VSVRTSALSRVARAGLVAVLVATMVTVGFDPSGQPAVAKATTTSLGNATLVHRLFVIEVAGLWPDRVGPTAARFNLGRYGARTPAGVVRRFRPGGVILFQDNISSVDQVRQLTRGLQQAARSVGYELLVMTDQEGGRVSRLPGPVAESQPPAASYDGNGPEARRDARAVGAAMRGMHVMVNLAPVADVNTVGDDGVIGDRSFGSEPDVVSRMVRAQVCGYHDGGVATTIKHWPGHGSTLVDSHQSLPTLTLPVRRWRRVHLPPFREGIAAGTDLVMVGHLAYPALDPSGLPASLSHVLTHDWLRNRLGFQGVIVTDALTMGALQDLGGSARLAVRAVRAGADLLLMAEKPRAAARALVDLVNSGKISRHRVRQSVTRVERLRDRLGLTAGPLVLPHCAA